MKTPTLGIISLLLFHGLRSLSAQTIDIEAVKEKLAPEIERALIEGSIPSCTVALVAGDRVVWASSFGFSNIWARTPAVQDTVYLIGSTFKTLSTAALLQQMEEGRFGLDDPVAGYLGELQIQGGDPENPITFRHLLTHTSGLPVDFGPHDVWGNTVPRPLEEYLADKLSVDGPPLRQVRYSNTAYSLVAYLVQRFSGKPYRTYMQERIFDPLEMTSTVFRPTPQIMERLAVPYVLDQQKHLVPTVRLKADVWPAGIVYGTVGDQAKWLIAVLNGGLYKGKRILQQSTVESTLVRQYDQFAGVMHAGWGNDSAGFGLTWWTAIKNGDRHFAHSGSVPGFTAFLEGNYDRKLGFAILTNGHRAHPHLVRLADLALTLLKEHGVPDSPQAGK